MNQLKKGDRLSYDEVRLRIADAVMDLDAEDLVVVHEIVAIGKLQYQPDGDEYVVVEEDSRRPIDIVKEHFANKP